MAGLVATPVSSLAANAEAAMDDARDVTAEALRKRFTPETRLPGKRSADYQLESDGRGAQWQAVHEGKGEIGVTLFSFGCSAIPVSFVSYDLPPGSSEGVHTHLLDDPVEGSFDEFYYIVAGSGRMRIRDDIVQVKAGDHVFTPIGTPHGIENDSDSEHLKVMLTFLYR
jgi:uncharacterized RmlC-like cupin family protein